MILTLITGLQRHCTSLMPELQSFLAPCHAETISGNIKINLPFLSFLNNIIAHIVEILHSGREGPPILHTQCHDYWWPGNEKRWCEKIFSPSGYLHPRVKISLRYLRPPPPSMIFSPLTTNLVMCLYNKNNEHFYIFYGFLQILFITDCWLNP